MSKQARMGLLAAAGLLLAIAAAAQAGTVSYRNTVLGDSPLVYYEFDETSGTTAANSGSTGGGNTGTINGMVAINQSSFPQGGTSYDFGGGRVTAAAISTMTEWTVEAWINWDPAKTSASNFFGNDQGGWNNDVLFGIGTETGGMGVPAGNVGLIQQGAPGSTRDYVREPLTHSVWHHVVATGSTTNGELKLYVDGALVDTDSSLVNGVTMNGHQFAVGGARFVSDAGTRPFDGLVDEFALYGTALDATKVQAHYDAGVGGGPPPPPPGTFTVSQPLNDWSTEIQPGTYTHALNFGNSTNSPTINTVPFVASQHGNFPGGNGNLSYIQSWNGTDGNNVINDGGLADEFLHSNTSGAALNLTGLTPGQEYLLKLFYVGWDANGDRTATFLDIDTGAQIVFDSEANGNNQGSVLSYQYIAQPDGQLNLSIDFARQNQAPHTYALTNQEVTAVIPEPATMALLSLAACGLGGYVRRRRKA